MLVGTGFAALGRKPVAPRERRSGRNSANQRFNLFHAALRGRA